MGSIRTFTMAGAGKPRRAKPRRRVMLTARLATPVGNERVRLRDVSANGARIEGDNLPPHGTPVQLTRGTFSVFGLMVWHEGEAGGVEFDEPLDEARLLEALKGLSAGPNVPEPYRRPGLRHRQSTGPRYSDGSGWVDATKPPRRG
jgi:hypothetical protein